MYQKFGKRIIDFLVSLAFIIVFCWLFAILAIIIKVTSPGPVLFKQKRVARTPGVDLQFFEIFKFRTMYIDTPKDMPTHLLDDPESFITPIGKFLRKTSLDELPQMFNILGGSMSFIGPRPALWNQEDLMELRVANGSAKAVPGLTGLAQISGRDELEIGVKAGLDGEYAKKISFLGDVKIFVMTFVSVLKSDGVVEGKK
ncbi:MAG: sugar transferase [Lactobacillales bacterium]|jgi:O-antigen biosynthesis protein WbqP|nr:sugar transferase [Lactobacillales bacterium]